LKNFVDRQFHLHNLGLISFPMRRIMLLLCLLNAIGAQKLFSQNTVCDSINIDSVYIDNNLLVVTVYNSSQHFIVYPYFTISLFNNSDIQINDSILVLSYLSRPGDANNGYTSGTYIANIAAANTVPLNTLFTGILTIADPNDSTFSCSFPFSFLYGTMPTFINEIKAYKYEIFPNPAAETITISAIQIKEGSSYTIIDQFGKIVANGLLNNNQNTIDISQIANGMYNLLINNGKLCSSKMSIIKNKN
jgi:hypothetical protein